MGLFLLIVALFVIAAFVRGLGPQETWPHDIMDGNDHQWKE